jgi:putative PIN family toxin of toxin-antitoxin system
VLRVVLDANVVVSGLMQPRGPSGRILAAVVERSVQAVVSPAVVDEYRRALGYPKIRKRLAAPPDVVAAWVDAFALLAEVVPGERRVAVVAADREDDKYLGAALEGRATHLVSGDRHLLDLVAHEGIRILPPRAFLEAMERGTPA